MIGISRYDGLSTFVYQIPWGEWGVKGRVQASGKGQKEGHTRGTASPSSYAGHVKTGV